LLVVLDADVIIAGTLAETGACHDILDNWLAGGFEVAMCPRLLWEVEKALRHPRISRKFGLHSSDIDSWIQRLSAEASVNRDPENPPSRVPDDPTDDCLIQLALDSEAGLLVSRDRHLERADIPTGLELVKPTEFAVRLQAQ
jgi:putative PIN family toxin of toxin-antitoxin system